MNFLSLLLLLLSSYLCASQTYLTQIEDIDYGELPNEETLVFLSNGIVAKLNPQKWMQPKDFFSPTHFKSTWFKVKLSKERLILNIKKDFKQKSHAQTSAHFHSNSELFETYIPTTIEDLSTAKNYFREARYNPKESQCFNRAMVWTYEWWKKHSLRSQKILIFFSRNYIRRYNFEWWFHIAPLVHVLDKDKVVEKVMDRKYTSGPKGVIEWANIFLRNDAPCPMIKKYSDYADHPYTGECMLLRTHMFTYQPADLQMYEAWGYQKNSFVKKEVRDAYLEAFDEVLQ